mgnify:CR=1 FL=1|jgi:biopolymer transport protein ExbB
MDIKNLFTAGGVVMWPLLLSSVLAVGLIVERIKFWVIISTRQQLVLRNVLNLYRQNNVVSTIDTLRKNPDISARVLLKPQELPVGVMTPVVGAPFFVYLAKSKVKK